MGDYAAMVDILVRDIAEEAATVLKARADQNGRTLAEELRTIVEAEAKITLASTDITPAASRARSPSEGFGTYWARRFDEIGLTPEEHDTFQRGVEEARRLPWRNPPSFEE